MRLPLPPLRSLLALAWLALAAAVPRSAAAQEETEGAPSDSASSDSASSDSMPAQPAQQCLAPDSAALDSAVRVAIASTRPRPITPKIIVVDRPAPTEHRRYTDASWELVDLSEGTTRASIQVALMYVNPRTRVRQLLVRVPPNTVLPSHSHSADETQLVIRGTVRVRDAQGRDEVLGPGGLSYFPARTPHAMSTGSGEEALLFVTSSGEWDIHLAEAARGP